MMQQQPTFLELCAVAVGLGHLASPARGEVVDGVKVALEQKLLCWEESNLASAQYIITGYVIDGNKVDGGELDDAKAHHVADATAQSMGGHPPQW